MKKETQIIIVILLLVSVLAALLTVLEIPSDIIKFEDCIEGEGGG